MSQIKPPDGRPPVGAPTGEPADATAADGAAGPSFDEVLRSGQTDAAAATSAAGGADPISELAGAVQRGELTGQQAIEQLVERAAGDMAAHLNSAQRTELLAALRDALATDPTLRQLADAL